MPPLIHWTVGCYVFQVSFVSFVFRHILRHIFYFHLRSVRYCISVAYFDEAASVVHTRGLAVPFPQCSLFICALRQYLFRLFRRTPYARLLRPAHIGRHIFLRFVGQRLDAQKSVRGLHDQALSG